MSFKSLIFIFVITSILFTTNTGVAEDHLDFVQYLRDKLGIDKAEHNFLSLHPNVQIDDASINSNTKYLDHSTKVMQRLASRINKIDLNNILPITNSPLSSSTQENISTSSSIAKKSRSKPRKKVIAKSIKKTQPQLQRSVALILVPLS